MMRMWVGPAEGQALAQYLTGTQIPRPQTYEFIGRLLDGVGSKVERVEVTELVDDTFIASVHVRTGNRSLQIDSRPSDAINVAVRSQAPIFWAEEIVERVGFVPGSSGPEGREWWERPGAEPLGMNPRLFYAGIPGASLDDTSEWITGAEMLSELERRQQDFIARVEAESKEREPREEPQQA
jgi:bifunctional DNase/RNase